MIQLMMSNISSSRGLGEAITMSGAGAASRKLSICVILLSFGCPRPQAVSTSSNMGLQAALVLDLNRTIFINTIVLNTTFDNHDYVDVDIGAESCDLFDDKACYVTCSSRKLVENTAYYVTMNVTCDVDNVKGRYVRVRQNTTTGLPGPCDVKVIGWPDLGKDFKNFALNASCVESSNYYESPNRAVDGSRNGYYFNHSCTHTHLSYDPHRSHWWRVDLGKLIFVSHIIIANRIDCCSERLANFTVELGRLESSGNITYTLCCYHDGVAGPLTTLNCTRSIWGQFVRISLTGEALTLCEVEVYGDVDDNITRHVPVILTSSICDDVPGTSLAPSNMTTSNMTTWRIKPSQGTTEAKVSQTFLDITSKASDNSNAKVSTMYSVITTKAQVSTVFPDLTTAAKRSTMNPGSTTKAKVSTEYPELTTAAKVSTMTQEVTTKAKVSTVAAEVTTKGQGTTLHLELTTKAKVSTMYPTVVTETKLYTEQSHYSQIIPAAPKEYNSCTCWKITTKSQDEVHQKIKQTTKSLKMNHSALGKQVRKKSSASDQRVSASATGIACTITFSFIFIIIVLCDVYGLCQYLFKKKKEKRREQ